MSWSNTEENAILDYRFDTVHGTDCWLALFDGSPTDDGTGGTEVSEASYARVNLAGNWDPAANGEKRLTNAVVFNVPATAWGPVSHFGLYTASTGGTLIAWGTFSTTSSVGVGNPPTIAAGTPLARQD